MLAVGPDAPTLCDPWRVRDLAAHLIIRETRPDLAAGMFVPRLGARLERAQDELAATDFAELVERVRSGPPRWSAAGVPAVDEAMNRMEFFVHHEDVLRGDPTTPRRDLDPGLAKAVWSGLILDPPIDCVRWAAWESENALLTWENATCLRSA